MCCCASCEGIVTALLLVPLSVEAGAMLHSVISPEA